MRGLVAIAGAVCVAVLALPAVGTTATTTSVGTSLREGSIILQRLSAPHGKITFYVHNYGQDDHNVAVRRRGVQYGFTGRIRSRGDATLTVTLRPGIYNVFCTFPGHRQAGMLAQLRVT
jgi:hypothetical protein